jgi:AraC-like DNA-binding protein
LTRSLIRSGVGLAEAGCEAGFADQSHFHRAFREAAGMTPNEFCARALAVSEIG